MLRDGLSSTVSTPVSSNARCRWPANDNVRCQNRNLRPMWDILVVCKSRILEMVWSPTTPTGLKLVALKFMQRVILVQTRGVSDPRVSPGSFLISGFHPDISLRSFKKQATRISRYAPQTIHSLTLPSLRWRGRN